MENLNEKTFNLLEATGLNWTVNKEPLISLSGKSTESSGIFRNDNGNWLGTVGERYTTFQNHEMAEMVLTAADGINIKVERGGMLYGGCKTYLQAELPETLIGNGIVKRWLTCLNSHDGSTSIGFGSANTTVICQNTFFRAFGEIEKIRHTASAKDRVDTMIRDMRAAIGLDEKLMESFKRMADMQIKDEAVQRVINVMFNVDAKLRQDDISTRKMNQVKDFARSIDKSISEQGATIWALFNGVTRYTNHIAAPANEDKKKDYLFANGGAALSNTAYETILKYVTENTAELVYIDKV